MRSGNSGHRLPSINKSEGQTEYVLGMYALIFVMILSMATLQILQYKTDSDIAEDALAASALASLDVDPYRYGTDHKLVINDPSHALEIFQNALKGNMELDADYRPLSQNSSYISGAVTIEDFRIYLVDADEVTEYRVSGYGTDVSTGLYGEMKTPGGQIVRSAGCYAAVSFDTDGFLGIKIRAYKQAYAEMIADPERVRE